MSTVNFMSGLDERNARLLAELLVDSSQKDTELSKKIGVASSTIGKRKRELVEAGVIKQFSCLLDYEKIGLTTIIITFISCKEQDETHINEFEKEMSDMPEIVDLYKMTGDWDYCARIVVENNPEFDIVRQKMSALSNFEKMSSEVVISSVFSRNRIVDITEEG